MSQILEHKPHGWSWGGHQSVFSIKSKQCLKGKVDLKSCRVSCNDGTRVDREIGKQLCTTAKEGFRSGSLPKKSFLMPK